LTPEQIGEVKEYGIAAISPVFGFLQSHISLSTVAKAAVGESYRSGVSAFYKDMAAEYEAAGNKEMAEALRAEGKKVADRGKTLLKEYERDRAERSGALEKFEECMAGLKSDDSAKRMAAAKLAYELRKTTQLPVLTSVEHSDLQVVAALFKAFGVKAGGTVELDLTDSGRPDLIARFSGGKLVQTRSILRDIYGQGDGHQENEGTDRFYENGGKVRVEFFDAGDKGESMRDSSQEAWNLDGGRLGKISKEERIAGLGERRRAAAGGGRDTADRSSGRGSRPDSVIPGRRAGVLKNMDNTILDKDMQYFVEDGNITRINVIKYLPGDKKVVYDIEVEDGAIQTVKFDKDADGKFDIVIQPGEAGKAGEKRIEGRASTVR
ncbi:hypothetical protein ACFL1X_12820, partial [Candidatus Hydrogenedentota bacterium]